MGRHGWVLLCIIRMNTDMDEITAPLGEENIVEGYSLGLTIVPVQSTLLKSPFYPFNPNTLVPTISSPK